MNPLAVCEVELERVEGAPRDRGGQAGAVRRILEREVDGLPARLPPELGGEGGEPNGRFAEILEAAALTEQPAQTYRDCRRPWTLMYVTANGNVLPCCIAT